MLELSAVLSSDSVTRNFTRFSAGGIYRGLADLWKRGIPSLIGHDSHRLAGWTIPTALSFQPGLTRLHGVSLLPETDEERTALEASYQRHLAARVASETAPHIAELRTLLAEHLKGDEEPLDCGATALVGPDLARRAAPKLFAMEDKDGLVPLAGLVQVQAGVYRHGDLVLFAHPVHRRSHSRWNNLNAPLLEELRSVASLDGVTVRLRLDPDVVGLAKTALTPIELEYWYGPKFSDDLASIPRGVARHEASELQRYFHGISRTEFWWQSRDGQHILEAEELRDIPTFGGGDNRYGCRYVHSIVDEETGRIIHLDGAVREYSEEEILARMDGSIADAGRRTVYTKGWRADGDIPLGRWKSLIHHHFRDNPLAGEYLDGKVDVTTPSEPPDVPESQERDSSVRALLPPRLSPGESVRLVLSLHPQPDAPLEAARVVRPLEDLISGGTKQTVVEADTVELRKLLVRQGHDLWIPDQAARLAFEDRYHSFPLIVHQDAAAVGPTLDAIEALVSAWINANNDRVASFALGLLLDDREIRIGLVGHVADIPPHIDLLRKLFLCVSHEDIANWVDDAARGLAAGTEDADESPSSDGIVDRLMTPARTLRITRSIIEPDHLALRSEDGSPGFTLRLPVEEEELVAAVRAGDIRPALAWLIRDSTCSKCGASYATCPCSKYLDSDVAQRCTDASIAYAFWTDRPA